jgi:hypothetical protein
LPEGLSMITAVTCFRQPRSEASVRSARQAQHVPVSGGLRRQQDQRECALALRQVCERQDCSARIRTRWRTFRLDWADLVRRQLTRFGYQDGFLHDRAKRWRLALLASPMARVHGRFRQPISLCRTMTPPAYESAMRRVHVMTCWSNWGSRRLFYQSRCSQTRTGQ